MLAGGTESSKFSMDGVDSSTCDGGTVSDAGVAQGRLMVLVVEEFLDEELFEFKPSTRYIGWEVGFPVVTSFVRVRQLNKISKRGAHHGGVRDGFLKFLEEGTALLLAFEVLDWCEGISAGFTEVGQNCSDATGLQCVVVLFHVK